MNLDLSFYEGKRILVTGASGYLGSNLIADLGGIDCEITGFGRRQGDIKDPDIWLDLLPGVDIVFHFAAQTSAYAAQNHPEEDFRVNVMPMMHLLEACRIHGFAPIVLFSGTVTQAGLPKDLPVDENHPDQPVTHYDLHKLMAENYLKHYIKREIVRGASLRLSNLYGPGPLGQKTDRGILDKMIRVALEGKALTLYGEGRYLRDYLHVEDAVRAFLYAGASIEEINGRHFVISSGRGYSLADAFQMVAEKAGARTGCAVDVISVPPPSESLSIESRNFVGNPNLFSKLTGWRPRYSLEEGIEQTTEALQ